MNQPSWFSKFFSAEFSESSKRLILVALVFVFIVQFFLILYIKVEIANKDIAKENIKYLVILIGLFGGYITMELLTRLFGKKAELQAEVDKQKAISGTPENAVKVQNVESVTADNITLNEKAEEILPAKKTAAKKKT